MKTLVESFTRRDKKGRSQRVRSFRRKAAKLRKSASANVDAAKKAIDQKRVIGEGKNGRVIDLGFGRVKKEIKPLGEVKKAILLRGDEADIQRKAASLGIGPKVYKSTRNTITMAKVKGNTVERELANTKSAKRQLKIGYNVGATMRQLHDNQIVHGDSHLQNIYTTRNNKVKIIDYGISKAKNRPLKKGERLRDYKKLHKRSGDHPKFQEGFRKGYGEI